MEKVIPVFLTLAVTFMLASYSYVKIGRIDNTTGLAEAVGSYCCYL